MLASRTADAQSYTQQMTKLQCMCDELQQRATAAELQLVEHATKTAAIPLETTVTVSADLGRAVVARVSWCIPNTNLLHIVSVVFSWLVHTCSLTLVSMRTLSHLLNSALSHGHYLMYTHVTCVTLPLLSSMC